MRRILRPLPRNVHIFVIAVARLDDALEANSWAFPLCVTEVVGPETARISVYLAYPRGHQYVRLLQILGREPKVAVVEFARAS